MLKRSRAFSFVEVILIVLFLGIFAYIAVSKLQFATLRRQKADTIARRIETDLRRTRRLAIVNAANNTAGFAMNMTGGSPYSGYDVVNLDTAAVLDSHSIDSEVTCTGGSTFRFGPLGNLLSGSGTQLLVSSEGKTFTITVISGTGAVKCVEN